MLRSLLWFVEVAQVGIACAGVILGLRLLSVSSARYRLVWTQRIVNGRRDMALMYFRSDVLTLIAQSMFLALATVSLSYQMVLGPFWLDYPRGWLMPVLRTIGNVALCLSQLGLTADRRKFERE